LGGRTQSHTRSLNGHASFKGWTMHSRLSSLAMNLSDVGTKAIASLQVRVETREQQTTPCKAYLFTSRAMRNLSP
jgi:hypothetical protein